MSVEGNTLGASALCVLVQAQKGGEILKKEKERRWSERNEKYHVAGALSGWREGFESWYVWV